MRFEEDLQKFSIPEWRPKYVNYHELKAILSIIEEKYPRLKEAPKKEKKKVLRAPTLAIIGGLKQSPKAARRPSPVNNTMYDEKVNEPLVPVGECMEEAHFLELLGQEILKINEFFKEKEQEALLKSASLTSQIETLNELRKNPGLQLDETVVQDEDAFLAKLRCWKKKKISFNQKVETLKVAFQEFYRSLDLLQSYRLMNHTAFRKIVKKHDKITGLVTLDDFMKEVDVSHFMASRIVEGLIRDTEKLYTDHLEHGNSRNAMRSLRVPPEGFQPIDWITMTNGMLVGIVLSCLLAIGLALGYGGVSNRVHSEALFQMLRGTFLFIFFACLLSINTYVWKLFGVNYVFIFDLNARKHASYKDILHVAVLPLVWWSICTLAYSFSTFVETLPVRYTPLIIIVVGILYLTFPLDAVRLLKGRFWLLFVFLRVVSAPFFSVRFVDIFIADQFNSLVTAFLDIEFLICYYSFDVTKEDSSKFVCSSVSTGIRAIVACLPAWWRFAQCLRRYRDTKLTYNLVNAGKYASVFFVVLFSSLASEDKVKRGTASVTVYLYFWIFFALVNTLYSAAWDLLMDWSLLDKDAPHKFLRQKLIYPPWMYYCAIVFNVLCRLLWTLNISVGFFNLVASPPLGAALAIAEVLRRFVWNFIRLENEHVNNCEKFRVVKDIPLPFEYLTTEELNFAADEDYVAHHHPETASPEDIKQLKKSVSQKFYPINEPEVRDDTVMETDLSDLLEKSVC